MTHGSLQQHIWTFAAGISEGHPNWTSVGPCDASIDIHVSPLHFVSEDYFCESGVNEACNNITLGTHSTLRAEQCVFEHVCESRNFSITTEAKAT